MTKDTYKNKSKIPTKYSGNKRKPAGHTYGECSKKRALIKQRIHRLETDVRQLNDVVTELIEKSLGLERRLGDEVPTVNSVSSKSTQTELDVGED